MNYFKIAQNFLSETLIFQIEKKISKFLNFPIWTISKISNLENSTKFQFEKLQKLSVWNFLNIVDLVNSENVQFVKFQKFVICKI